jgi:lipid A 3-O-deacylase
LGQTNRSLRVPPAIASVMLLACLAPALASEIVLTVENDHFGGTDEQYSHGVRLTWVSSPRQGLAEWLLPPGRFPGARHVAVSLGNMVFTPWDLLTEDLVQDDRPYAGWTYLSAALLVLGEGPGASRQDVLELQAGMIGPGSGSCDFQNSAHRLLGYEEGNGWGHQLENEPGLLLAWERSWGLVRKASVQVLPHASISLGNVEVSVGLGSEVRAGAALPDQLSSRVIRPARFGVGQPAQGFGAHLFAGWEGRAVAHSVFLDGNTFRESHSVDRRPLVADVYAGFGMSYRTLTLSYAHVYRTPEYEEQSDGQSFGSIRLGWVF